jgi:hypothetical protein
MKPTCAHPALNPAGAKAKRQELCMRDNTMLATSQLGHLDLAT